MQSNDEAETKRASKQAEETLFCDNEMNQAQATGGGDVLHLRWSWAQQVPCGPQEL